jgi:hypothetical protein
MPGITIEFTEDELAQLRAEAQEKGIPIKRLAHDAIAEDIIARRQRQAFVAGATRYALEIKSDFDSLFEEGLR